VFDVIYKTKRVDFMLSRHEQGAGHMAESYAHVSGVFPVTLGACCYRHFHAGALIWSSSVFRSRIQLCARTRFNKLILSESPAAAQKCNVMVKKQADVIIALGALFNDRVAGKTSQVALAARAAAAQGRRGITPFKIQRFSATECQQELWMHLFLFSAMSWRIWEQYYRSSNALSGHFGSGTSLSCTIQGECDHHVWGTRCIYRFVMDRLCVVIC
jgi:hypothetical protein